jgi:prevent-host-death family protein
MTDVQDQPTTDVQPADMAAERFTVKDMEEIYESLPLSVVRQNLSQIVERVAYTGQPVLIAKHSKARVACVPLTVLAQAMTYFARSAAREEAEAADDRAGDIDFENAPGLAAAELDAKRRELQAKAQAEDAAEEERVRQVTSHPAFAAEVRKVVLRMATEHALD